MRKILFACLSVIMLALCMVFMSCGNDEPVPQSQDTNHQSSIDEDKYKDVDTSNPLTIEAIGNGVIIFKNRATGSVIYKVDGGAAQTITSGRICQIPVSAGQKIMFFGNNATYWPDEEASNISGTTDFYAYGNIMSLISSTNYRSLKSLNGDYAFASLFHGATHLRSHSTKPLTLPATKLSYGCYYGMFQGCSNLTTAPVLPAQTLSEGCYENMFSGCTRLNYVKCMAEGTVDGFIYTADWLEDVSSSGTFVKASGSSWSVNSQSGIPSGWTVINNGQQEPDEKEPEDIYPDIQSTPLTLEAIADGTITFRNKASGSVTYKIDGGEEQTIGTGRTTNISVTAGQKVRFFGDNSAYYSDVFSYSNISSTVDYYAYGNIMSLVNSKNYANTIKLTKEYTFAYLFQGSTHLRSHPTHELVLPAETLTDYCYFRMFNGCSSLTTPSVLPANKLAIGCYHFMYANCTNLKNTPILPAVKLASNCYYGMFADCSSLTAAPDLPATTLSKECYNGMFNGCGSLTAAPQLPATKLSYACYFQMFRNCTSLTIAPSLPATTLTKECYAHMFRNCTSLIAAPELPATTLAIKCYYYMFDGCASLNYVKCLATDVSASDCTYQWLNGVSSTGQFIKSSNMNSWRTNSISGIPKGWIVQTE